MRGLTPMREKGLKDSLFRLIRRWKGSTSWGMKGLLERVKF
jgi:hypothetical protein